MNAQDFKEISKALNLLWSLLEEQGGGTQEQKKILSDAEDVLRGYESCGGEV